MRAKLYVLHCPITALKIYWCGQKTVTRQTPRVTVNSGHLVQCQRTQAAQTNLVCDGRVVSPTNETTYHYIGCNKFRYKTIMLNILKQRWKHKNFIYLCNNHNSANKKSVLPKSFTNKIK